MTQFAIQAEGLGKRYRIGTAGQRHDKLVDVLAHAFTAPFRNLRNIRRLSTFEDEGDDVVWALRDVSFELRHGEALGIIGRNGAGKSTLLKILSRITDPTVGRALMRGRVGSLLEVGTGFHPELTGRENVYLNGSILGMDKAHIDTKFDEIVEFAGVARFIDTPVKRFSSGMYLRLAFAVAAHLEPEILIVDEVLAVGDAEFQKKCIGKMSEVAGHGRTVLFVSHNMGAVAKLCNRAILLSGGTMVLDGPPRDVIHTYLTSGASHEARATWEGDDAPGDRTCRLRAVSVCQPEGVPVSRIDIQKPFSVHVEYEAFERFRELELHLILSDESGDIVLQSTHGLQDPEVAHIPPGRHVSIGRFPAGALNAGTFWISLYGDVPYTRYVWQVEQVHNFEVENTDPRLSRFHAGVYRGPMGPKLVEWTREPAVEELPLLGELADARTG